MSDSTTESNEQPSPPLTMEKIGMILDIRLSALERFYRRIDREKINSFFEWHVKDRPGGVTTETILKDLDFALSCPSMATPAPPPHTGGLGDRGASGDRDYTFNPRKDDDPLGKMVMEHLGRPRW